MSTTKIFIIFGIFVFILTVPLLIIYIWFPIVLGRYASLVENVIVGTIGAYVVAFALDFILRLRQEKAVEQVARVGLTEVSTKFNRLIALFGSIFKAASDGFIPSTIDELFDAKAADLLSLHLDMNGRAPVTSGITWQEHITRESCLILNELTSVQDRYQAFLPGNSLVAIGKLRNNTLLIVFNQLSHGANLDKQENIQRPVINFIPLEKLTFLMNEILSCVKTIQQASIKLKTPTTPQFPSFDFRSDVEPKVGSARFEGNPGVPFIIGEIPEKSGPIHRLSVSNPLAK